MHGAPRPEHAHHPLIIRTRIFVLARSVLYPQAEHIFSYSLSLKCCPLIRSLTMASHPLHPRTAPVKASSARTTESGAVSKKEEIRARRFAPRDKTKKLLSTADAGAAVTTPGALRAGTDDGEEGGAGTAAQSFEALTRRNEAVADDLDRTEKGLAELEAEEAEEALENMGYVRAAVCLGLSFVQHGFGCVGMYVLPARYRAMRAFALWKRHG